MKSMKRLLLATAGLFTLGLASCNFPYSPVDPTPSGDVKSYTILMYVCGSDLESKNGFATADIKEILSVKCPETVNIAIQTGGASAWDSSSYGILANKSQRWHVSGNRLINDSTKADVNMGSSINFQSFLEWGLTTYPADRVGLILWNHGGGIAGVCSDENHNDALTTHEVSTAVKAVRTKLNITNKLEWIGYDACLMNVADIATVNAEDFNYMIAAQESELGYGWDYDTFLPVLYKNVGIATPTLLAKICDSFIIDTNHYDNYDITEYNNNTLSLLDLSKIDAFKSAVENIARTINITSSTKFKNVAAAAYKKSLRFGGEMDDYGNINDGFLHGCADALSLAKQLKIINNDVDVSALNSAINDLVIHNAYGDWYKSISEKPCGINLFVAYAEIYTEGRNQYGLQVTKTDYISSDTRLTNWRNFNYSYGFITQ